MGKESTCNANVGPGFHPWVEKIRWRRAWQCTLVFLAGQLHGQRGLVGYSPWGLKESDTTEVTEHVHTHTHTQSHIHFLISDDFPLVFIQFGGFTPHTSIQYTLPEKLLCYL